MPLVIDYRPIVLPAEERRPVAPVARPKRHLGAMGAIAALAAFGLLGWDGEGFQPAPARASVPLLQLFERAGENFPGSAFYFLDADSGVVPASGVVSATARAAPLDARLGDAVARPIALAGTAQDRFRALQCLTTAIYYEAATEPDAGQRAVAQVVLNRVAHPQWPNSVCGVVFQGSEAPGCQFSFACDGSMGRAPVAMWWRRAQAVAERALSGEVYAPVGLATYYHTGAVHPLWADRMTPVGAIGAHLFYRPAGAEGRAAAFTDRYWGGEPLPLPRPRVTAPLAPDPLAAAAAILTRSAGQVRPILPPPPQRTIEPVAAAPSDRLPQAGQVRPEFRNSGRWIASPNG